MAQLTNYIRALGGEAQRAAIQVHLASGCRKCRRTTDLLHKVEAATRSDSQVHVPDYALRCARAIFFLQQPEKCQILPTTVSANPGPQACAPSSASAGRIATRPAISRRTSGRRMNTA